MYCSKCGNEMAENQDICLKCGTDKKVARKTNSLSNKEAVIYQVMMLFSYTIIAIGTIAIIGNSIAISESYGYYDNFINILIGIFIVFAGLFGVFFSKKKLRTK